MYIFAVIEELSNEVSLHLLLVFLFFLRILSFSLVCTMYVFYRTILSIV